MQRYRRIAGSTAAEPPQLPPETVETGIASERELAALFAGRLPLAVPDECPPIPEELLLWLESTYREVIFEVNTPHDIFVDYNAARRVVRNLRAEFDAQNAKTSPGDD